jgi:hypothetical protein
VLALILQLLLVFGSLANHLPSSTQQTTPASSAPPSLVSTTYNGAWFSITIPAGFTTIPGNASATTTESVDDVSFRSPDGSVDFYVFSPQWNGTPTDFQPPKGTTIDTETKGAVVIRRATWRAADGMIRSLEDTEDTSLHVRRTFGIAYRDAAALARWRPTYVDFKASLQQFAD